MSLTLTTTTFKCDVEHTDFLSVEPAICRAGGVVFEIDTDGGNSVVLNADQVKKLRKLLKHIGQSNGN